MAQMEVPFLAPGFRFHPTDEELVVYYLRRKACGRKLDDGIIGELDLYKFEPWDLPEKCVLHTRDLEWYFFHAQDKKYPRSSRTNRATVAGYWKATGKDRRVCSGGHMAGTKKTLVFYLGRAPNGERTDWIMHEYRLDEEFEKNKKGPCAFVLCRIHQKRGPGPRNGEQYGAPVWDENDSVASCTQFSPTYGNQTHPELSENEVQQEHFNDLNQPISTAGLETSNQVSNDPGSVEMEGFISADDMILLQSLCESQHECLEPAYLTQGSSSIEHGLSEPMHISAMETVPRVPSIMDLEVDGLDDLHDILHPAPNEAELLGEMLDTLLGQGQTVPRVPNIMDLHVNGLDDLHDILHPAPNEAEMLGEMLDALIVDQGQIIPTIDSAVDQNERTSLPSFAYSQDLIGDNYIELADWEHPLDEYLLAMLAPETDGSVIEQEPSNNEDNGIEARTRSRWPQEQSLGLNEQGAAARRVRFQVSALQFDSENIGGSVYFEDNLQHPESIYTVDGLSPSSEVPMITSGEMEDISNLELQNAVNMYRSNNGESTFSDMSSGLGLTTSDPWSAELQIIKYDQKLDYTFLSDETHVYAVSECDKVPVQYFEVENVDVVEVPAEDGYTVMSRETPSASLSVNTFGGDVAAGIVSSRTIKSGLEELSSIVKTNREDVSSCLCLTGVNIDSMGILLSDQNPCSHLDSTDKVLEALPQDVSSNAAVYVSTANRGQADTIGSSSTVKKDEIVIRSTKQENTLEIASAPGQDHLAVVNNVVQHSSLGDQRAYPIESTGSPGQLTNINSYCAVPAREAASGSSSVSTLPPHQLPKSLLWIFELLEDVPALPASAAEFCLNQGQCKPAKKSPLDSEVTSNCNNKTVTANSEECFCFCKGEKEHLQAMLPVRSTLNKTSSGLTSRVKSDFPMGAKQLSGLPEVQCDCFFKTTSNHKMPGLRKLLSGIFCINDHRNLCKSLSHGFTILLFWGATLALIFFCLIRGFWRLRKGALTMIF